MGALNLQQNIPIYLGPENEAVRIGTVRKSMKNNELLQKLEVEKPRNRCRDLPGYGHIYGIPSQVGGGVAEALNGWSSSKIKPFTCQDPSHRVKNFIGMNRSAAAMGFSHARDHELFRKQHTMTTLDHPAIRSPRARAIKLPTEVTYGRPNLKHEPMFEILQNKFQNDFIAEKLIQETRETNFFMPKRVGVGEVKEIKEEAEPEEPPPQSFGTIQPAIFSFRSEDERIMALNRRALRLEAEKIEAENKANARRHLRYLRKSIPLRQRLLDVRRRTVPPKIYSMYSGVYRTDGGEIGIHKRGEKSPCKSDNVPWRPINV